MMNTPIILLIALSLVTVSCDDRKRDFDATGLFEATEVTVSAEGTGRLLALDIKEGDKLIMGQQVGLIDTTQLYLKVLQLDATKQSFAEQRPNTQRQIAAIQRQLEHAKRELLRAESLLQEGAGTQKQKEDAATMVKVLQGQLDAQVSTLTNSTNSLNSQVSSAAIQRAQILDQLQRCHISSPITGIVLEKYAERGEFAIIGKPLFQVADIDNMVIRAYFTTQQLSKIKLGQMVSLFCDYGHGDRKEYQGKVVWISARAEFTPKTILTDDERANVVYAVKIAVKNDGYLKIGMYGEVKL